MPRPKSLLLPPLSTPPPKYVEYMSADPAALILLTKASYWPKPMALWNGLTVGKSVDIVNPVT